MAHLMRVITCLKYWFDDGPHSIFAQVLIHHHGKEGFWKMHHIIYPKKYQAFNESPFHIHWYIGEIVQTTDCFIFSCDFPPFSVSEQKN